MIKKELENQRKNLQQIQQLELKNEKTLKEISKIKRLKKAKGITLIALIITIIILIILAGITLVALSGENGILKQATKAKEQIEIASVKEQAQLDIANWMAERLKNNEDTTLDDSTIKSIIETANASNSNKYYKELQGDKIITPSGYEILYSELYTNGNGETEIGGLPSTNETQPFLPDGATPTNTDWNTGITIKDSNNNEWVWIVVPKSLTATSTTDDEIKNALISYATDYRTRYSDTWYSGCGLSQSEYEENYSKMLQSIKANGGFYIGKYEVGSFDEPVTSNDNTRQAVIQKGAYPYNYVTCSQAEDLAEGLATGGKTSTLMFGIQWDLVLKYLEENGKWDTTTNEASYYLKTNSSSWGNYANNSFPVTEGNKYAIYNQSTYQLGEWNPVPSDYEKPNSGTESWVLLSTGVVEDNSKMNIYDLAGNVFEWTLEKSTDTSDPCAGRGGSYGNDGSDYPASSRYNFSTSDSVYNIGFRPALY